ncbi:Dynactin subunit 5 [Seminavis robusta]|uniref:Dynactin subunit 5 n=1 Tax=Seminavis robusta TaxID=568900 RepID=A0A9N8HE12_9STRA|nr:Dynactin subunit 5 [Seminavis robusta]|eukprot:Sro489_g153370.1 Dynactin subunit 5 (191) ;mRNA; f:52162-52734
MAESASAAESTTPPTDGYIKTTTHNFISRQAKLENVKQVAVQGRSIIHGGVTLRGDVGIVRLGRYVWMEPNTELEPAAMSLGGGRVAMAVGNHTRIGPNCRIQAAQIGSMVHIGENVKIGKRCMIKDCCIIDSNVILGDDTVVPPFTRISYDGEDAFTLKLTELPPSMTVDMQEQAMDNYDTFASKQRAR